MRAPLHSCIESSAGRLLIPSKGQYYPILPVVWIKMMKQGVAVVYVLHQHWRTLSQVAIQNTIRFIVRFAEKQSYIMDRGVATIMSFLEKLGQVIHTSGPVIGALTLLGSIVGLSLIIKVRPTNRTCCFCSSLLMNSFTTHHVVDAIDFKIHVYDIPSSRKELEKAW